MRKRDWDRSGNSWAETLGLHRWCSTFGLSSSSPLLLPLMWSESSNIIKNKHSRRKWDISCVLSDKSSTINQLRTGTKFCPALYFVIHRSWSGGGVDGVTKCTVENRNRTFGHGVAGLLTHWVAEIITSEHRMHNEKVSHDPCQASLYHQKTRILRKAQTKQNFPEESSSKQKSYR